jgi:hypothetical protein
MLVLHTEQVPEAMGKNGAIERNLIGDRWLTGDVASVHAVIAKKRRITVTIRVQNVVQRFVTV